MKQMVKKMDIPLSIQDYKLGAKRGLAGNCAQVSSIIRGKKREKLMEMKRQNSEDAKENKSPAKQV